MKTLVDNFNNISLFLEAVQLSDDEFFFLQVIKRRKDNPEIGADNVLIKPYFISRVEKLRTLESEIKRLCFITNARAMIHVTPRSYKTVAHKTLEDISKQCANNAYKAARSSYLSACGKFRSPNNQKFWFIDVDSKEEEALSSVAAIPTSLLLTVETPNGYHIVIKPFDTRLTPAGVQVNKNNPILLYCNLDSQNKETSELKEREG